VQRFRGGLVLKAHRVGSVGRYLNSGTSSDQWTNLPVAGSTCRKVDVRLPGKGDSTPHDARPVHLIITMIKWIRTFQSQMVFSKGKSGTMPSMALRAKASNFLFDASCQSVSRSVSQSVSLSVCLSVWLAVSQSVELLVRRVLLSGVRVRVLDHI